MTADNSENLAILLEQGVRVPWQDGPGEKPLVRPGYLQDSCSEGLQLMIRMAFPGCPREDEQHVGLHSVEY